MKGYFDVAGDGGSGVEAQVASQRRALAARFAGIRRVVAVLSGKGGVGKSALTANLASNFAARGDRVGILDADLNGPSIARMTGVRGRKPALEAGAAKPVEGPAGLRVMSLEFFLEREDAPVLWRAPTQRDAHTWRGTIEMSALRELLTDADWGLLDWLWLDLPPGTDRLQNLADLLPRLDGVVLVTIPSDASSGVVRRTLTMARDVVRVPVVGLVENMAGYACGSCGAVGPLFRGEEAGRLAETAGVPLLGRVPFDTEFGSRTDRGEPFAARESPAARALAEIAAAIDSFFVERDRARGDRR